MLGREREAALLKRYGGERTEGIVKKAFDQRVNEALQVAFGAECSADSAALFVDIAGFSSTVAGWTATKIRGYLDDFYGIAIPEIYGNQGHVDRIVGDGILAIYSGLLAPALADQASLAHAALKTAESIIKICYGTSRASKAAISFGDLLYCKTGLAGIYEDLTVIGEPITTTYRMEDIANVNEVIFENESPIGRLVQAQLQTIPIDTIRARQRQPPVTWFVDNPRVVDLKGIGSVTLRRQIYREPK